MDPKVFISYSWSSEGHKARILQWSEQLMSDGIDVVLDVWDLKEGHDKYKFMERMVSDESVTHVLVFSDSLYAEKARKRQAGVGTESQIISAEVYEAAEESKFIPIVCEFDDSNEPCLPPFLKARRWIDFSSPEAAHEHWEQLIRVLYGEPELEKPALGKKPAYLSEAGSAPASPASAKFEVLRQAVLQDKPSLALYRRDFLDACLGQADALRAREAPDGGDTGEYVISTYKKLRPVRNHLVDWAILESGTKSEEFESSVFECLEGLLEVKCRPAGLSQWQDFWYEGHAVFVHEVFLYLVAAMLKTRAFDALHQLLTTQYLLPENLNHGGDKLGSFDAFQGQSRELKATLKTDDANTTYLEPNAELMRRHADRTDIPFDSIIEADLLTLLMAAIRPEVWYWHPCTVVYARRGHAYPFFLRATQRRSFLNLAIITGIDDADELRAKVKEGFERLNMENWNSFHMMGRSLTTMLNMEGMDTVQ